MTEEVDDEQQRLERSFKEAQSLEDNQIDDPLSAVKAVRLKELAVCRINTAEEIQRMHDKSSATQVDPSNQE